MGKMRMCPNPECQTDQQAGEIPRENRHLYGASHFMRSVGFYAFDLTLFYFCPDCNGAWHRFAPEDGLYFTRAAEQMAANDLIDYTPSTTTEVTHA